MMKDESFSINDITSKDILDLNFMSTQKTFHVS